MVMLLSLLLSVIGGIGMAVDGQSPKAARDPSFEKLNFFVGDWKADAKVLPGRFGPGGQTSGTTRYKWEIGDQWLVFDSAFELPGVGNYQVHGVVSYDPKEGKYISYAFNNLAPRGVEYRGEWKDENTLVFTSVAKSTAGTLSRVVYTKLPEGKLRFTAAESTDGATFTSYFDAILSR